ncbi:ATP-grasp domain-containing protein [Roseomonas sp. KE2513]|uniref:ATP-grasp domain-containing protein n=1 Tax=Roseomonas sp. KE2513 TaxID=2479202 RepID=UPI0018DF848E|nr:ATP-grasp domain-containing protein [Roseomonas sp. KE2513]MBI0539063.1 ATP-grasp domain-containing protein [Roseomonas sp. KE2513]
MAAPPRLLVLSTQPWPFAARLTMALRRAGFHVEGASPPRAYLGRSAAPMVWHRLRTWRLLPDLAGAIRAARPDRLVPCDDVAAELVVALHADPFMRGLVEASLGDPAGYPVALSKGAQMALAERMGLPIPPTLHLADRRAFDAALAAGPLPQVLKVDGGFGGEGVAVLRDTRSADAAWTRLTSPPSLLAAAKRAAHERSPRALVARRAWRPSTPHLQEFAQGRPANRAVLCERGQVVAGLSVVAVHTTGENGPTSTVRVVDSPVMAATAEAFVARLGLSGFYGFDFVLASDGQALMLEMNPRATPICHLARAGEHGLAAAMLGVVGRAAPPVSLPAPGDTIALFPNEYGRDPASPHLQGWHDVPWDDLPLLRAALDDLALAKRPPGLARQVARRLQDRLAGCPERQAAWPR